ncbi:hypothetical protein I4U23_005363 [Adineta vaga]|nr:hypothetical protein I4U23_005363 [Adineta vaga]
MSASQSLYPPTLIHTPTPSRCEDHPYIADNLTSLGNIFKERGQYDNAYNTYVQALNIYEKINPNEHPESAVVLHGIGYVNQENGDYETSLLYYRKVEIIYRKYMSPKNPNFIRLLLCFTENAHDVSRHLYASRRRA